MHQSSEQTKSNSYYDHDDDDYYFKSHHLSFSGSIASPGRAWHSIVIANQFPSLWVSLTDFVNEITKSPQMRSWCTFHTHSYVTMSSGGDGPDCCGWCFIVAPPVNPELRLQLLLLLISSARRLRHNERTSVHYITCTYEYLFNVDLSRAEAFQTVAGRMYERLSAHSRTNNWMDVSIDCSGVWFPVQVVISIGKTAVPLFWRRNYSSKEYLDQNESTRWRYSMSRYKYIFHSVDRLWTVLFITRCKWITISMFIRRTLNYPSQHSQYPRIIKLVELCVLLETDWGS